MSESVSQLRDMKFEEARLTTFQAWPSNAKVEAWKMAKAGLFHTGNDEEVKCTWCGCLLNNWQYGDQVMAKHRLASPTCPFIQNMSDNVPLVPGENNANSVGNNSNDNDVGDNGGGEDVDDVSSRMMETDHSPPSGRSPSTSVSEPSPDLRSESARLATFTGWPVGFMSAADLAAAGFFYLGRGDSCRCAFCGSYVGDWVEGDQPLVEHRNLFPMCPFIRGLEVGNIPISSGRGGGSDVPPAPAAPVGTTGRGQDDTGPRWHRSPNAGPEKGNGFTHSFMKQLGQSSTKEPENIGIIKHTGPLHPNYATTEARLRTFREWPPALKQQPKELADAGFYYIGLSDQVKCFYCDGGLRNWQPEDVPWIEHSRWFSKCVFVRLVKGDEFVAKALLERPPETRAGVPAVRTTHDRPPVSEEEVRAMMSDAVVHQALSMGIDASRIKMAIKRRLETAGTGFETAQQLINAAFSVQREQEDRTRVENSQNNSAFLRTPEESRANQQSYDEVTERLDMFLPPSSGGTAMTNSIEVATPAVEMTEPAPAPTTSRGGEDNTGPQSLPTTPQVTTPPSPQPPPSCNSLPMSSAPPPASLQDENARLKEQRTCKICMDGEVGVVFLPCGHLCACVNCAPALKDCPVCRTTIQGTVRTYMS